jgi:transcriptional regulator with XRE-family HTH domain
MELRQYLKDKKLSVVELANRIGVSRQAVYGWLTGQYRPTYRHALLLHRISGGTLSIHGLMGVEDV